MRRVLLLALGVALLAVPAATAAPRPCWQRVIMDWYVDGKFDRAWGCNCVSEAVAHLPTDMKQYANFDALYAAQRKACRLATRRIAAPAPKAQKQGRNYPALITSTVLAVVVIALLLWRRRQLLERRRRRD